MDTAVSIFLATIGFLFYVQFSSEATKSDKVSTNGAPNPHPSPFSSVSDATKDLKRTFELHAGMIKNMVEQNQVSNSRRLTEVEVDNEKLRGQVTRLGSENGQLYEEVKLLRTDLKDAAKERAASHGVADHVRDELAEVKRIIQDSANGLKHAQQDRNASNSTGHQQAADVAELKKSVDALTKESQQAKHALLQQNEQVEKTRAAEATQQDTRMAQLQQSISSITDQLITSGEWNVRLHQHLNATVVNMREVDVQLSTSQGQVAILQMQQAVSNSENATLRLRNSELLTDLEGYKTALGESHQALKQSEHALQRSEVDVGINTQALLLRAETINRLNGELAREKRLARDAEKACGVIERVHVPLTLTEVATIASIQDDTGEKGPNTETVTHSLTEVVTVAKIQDDQLVGEKISDPETAVKVPQAKVEMQTYPTACPTPGLDTTDKQPDENGAATREVFDIGNRHIKAPKSLLRKAAAAGQSTSSLINTRVKTTPSIAKPSTASPASLQRKITTEESDGGETENATTDVVEFRKRHIKFPRSLRGKAAAAGQSTSSFIDGQAPPAPETGQAPTDFHAGTCDTNADLKEVIDEDVEMGTAAPLQPTTPADLGFSTPVNFQFGQTPARLEQLPLQKASTHTLHAQHPAQAVYHLVQSGLAEPSVNIFDTRYPGNDPDTQVDVLPASAPPTVLQTGGSGNTDHDLWEDMDMVPATTDDEPVLDLHCSTAGQQPEREQTAPPALYSEKWLDAWRAYMVEGDRVTVFAQDLLDIDENGEIDWPMWADGTHTSLSTMSMVDFLDPAKIAKAHAYKAEEMRAMVEGFFRERVWVDFMRHDENDGEKYGQRKGNFLEQFDKYLGSHAPDE